MTFRSRTVFHLRSLPALLPAFLLLFSSPLPAADFDLFERGRGASGGAETKPAKGNRPKPKPNRPANKKKGVDKPFVLRGTARLGRHYSAVIETPKGEDIRVVWDGGAPVTIPGYDGFRVSKIDPREVVVLLPPEVDCVDVAEAGLRCNSKGNAATLSLAWRNATPPKASAKEKGAAKVGGKKAGDAGKKGDKAKENPFLSALRRASEGKEVDHQEGMSDEEKKLDDELRKKRAERYKNFKPKVIRDDEVPPGMKVVRTPFGDRLVPLK